MIVKGFLILVGIAIVVMGFTQIFLGWPDDVVHYTGKVTFNTIEEEEGFGEALLDKDIKVIRLSSTENSPITTHFELSAHNGKEFEYGQIDRGGPVALLFVVIVIGIVLIGLGLGLDKLES